MTLRIAFAGTPDVAIPSLRALIAAGHDVVAVITRPDAPAGRGRVLTPSPVAQFAEQHGIPTLKPTKPSEIADALSALNLDCIPVVAYGALIPPAMLSIPKYGWVNLHFSVLPAWRGAAPVQRALIAGDAHVGATTFRLVDELDAGPVFASITRPVAADDTAGTVLTALADDGAALLVRTLATIATTEPVAQSANGVTFAPKLGKADAHIDWQQSATDIERCIRGCTPEPGAWSAIASERIGIAPVLLRPDVTSLRAGALLIGADVLVGTGTHAVQLMSVKPAGKGWMPAADWGRGLRAVPEGFDADR